MLRDHLGCNIYVSMTFQLFLLNKIAKQHVCNINMWRKWRGLDTMLVESGKSLKPSQGRGNQTLMLPGIRCRWMTWTCSLIGLTRLPPLQPPLPQHLLPHSHLYLPFHCIQLADTPASICPSSSSRWETSWGRLRQRRLRVQKESDPRSSSPVQTSCAGLWSISSTWAWSWEKCQC